MEKEKVKLDEVLKFLFSTSNKVLVKLLNGIFNENFSVDEVELTVSNNEFVEDDLGILIKKGESKNFTKKIKVNEDIKLPVKKGSVLGKAMIYQDGKLIDEVELVNNKDIEKASYIQMLKRLAQDII